MRWVDRGVEALVGQGEGGRCTGATSVVPATVVGPFRSGIDHRLLSDQATGATCHLAADKVRGPLDGPTLLARSGVSFGSAWTLAGHGTVTSCDSAGCRKGLVHIVQLRVR